MSMELYGSQHDGYAEVYHHGVKGMKWGVRRARREQAAGTISKVLKGEKFRNPIYNKTGGKVVKSAEKKLSRVASQGGKRGAAANLTLSEMKTAKKQMDRGADFTAHLLTATATKQMAKDHIVNTTKESIAYRGYKEAQKRRSS